MGQDMPLPVQMTSPMLDSIVRARNGSGTPTAADSAALNAALPGIIARLLGNAPPRRETGPTQCHDITVYPEIGLAGGACEGYGMLLDISDPVNPRRISFVADSNFAYWHSATFSNDGRKIMFTDEWGGGGAPKCRAIDKPEWGANAIFTIENGQMKFQSYFKLPAEQTEEENCVAHNGSLIPIPGRDVMVQGWYQGGILVFDWTDPKNPIEIAYHDRGPVDPTRMVMGGSWSVYWYNGLIVNSEIARGLDIFELVPSGFLSQNEIDAANTVKLDYLNPQSQPKFVWPPSFALARAYVDQLERSRGLSADRIAAVRQTLSTAERGSSSARRDGLNALASQLDGEAGGSRDAAKVRLLSQAVKDLAAARSDAPRLPAIVRGYRDGRRGHPDPRDGPLSAQAQASNHPDVLAAQRLFSAWMEGQVVSRGLPGIVVGVIADQELVWTAGFGHADIAAKRPMTRSTKFRMASHSKLFAATAIMQLREQASCSSTIRW